MVIWKPENGFRGSLKPSKCGTVGVENTVFHMYTK
jgi:hypothetical protein